MRCNVFPFLFMVTLIFSSCKDRSQLTMHLQNMQNKEIVFPQNLVPFYEKMDTLAVHESNALRLIVYFSKDMCTVCNMEKIPEWNSIKSILKRWNIIYILSFSEEENQEIIDFLIRNRTNEDIIYLDKGGMFKELNPFIGDNPLLHVFLIDSSNRIKIVGDPLYNEEVLKLYKDYYKKSVKMK